MHLCRYSDSDWFPLSCKHCDEKYQMSEKLKKPFVLPCGQYSLQCTLSKYWEDIICAGKLISLSIFKQLIFSFKRGDVIFDKGQPSTKRKWGQQFDHVDEDSSVKNKKRFNFNSWKCISLTLESVFLWFLEVYFSDCWKCISCWICSMIRTMVWQSDVLAAALITVIKWLLSKPTP